MSYKIIPTDYFKKQVKQLLKNYPHLRQDLNALNSTLLENPKCGKALGKKVYKIRLKSTDISKGKRSGYRVISYVMDDKEKIRLLTVYAKSRKANISDKEIVAILQQEGLIK